MQEIKKISIIGSGNVATHFARALFNSGYHILDIYSRNISNSKILAAEVQAKPVASIEELRDHDGLYIFSVSDLSYSQILPLFKLKEKNVVHTSGSLSIEILKNAALNYGVLYPFQTLSKEKNIKFRGVPLLYCASSISFQSRLLKLAKTLSDKVEFASDEQRKILHISAVFACNFTNYMYTIAEDIAIKNNIDFSLLYPLIKETAEKAMANSPKSVQTGPAIRNDLNIINNHIQLLESDPVIQEVYTLISNNIIKYHQNNGK